MSVILVGLKDTFDTWRKKTNSISLGVGDFKYIKSGDTTVIKATNRNFKNIGTLSALTTDINSTLVDAINEIDDNADTNAASIGIISSLDTGDKSSVVNAINEIYEDVGNTDSLTTNTHISLVLAINEVDAHTDTNTYNIGDMEDMPTLNGEGSDNIISALTEVDTITIDLRSLITQNASDIDDLEVEITNLWEIVGEDTLNTISDNLSGAVNELFSSVSRIGDLESLTTECKTTIVGAINEIDNSSTLIDTTIGNLSTLDTANQISIVDALNEIAGNSIAFALILG